MAPLITPLDAPTGPLVSLLIKLNGDLLEKLRECALKNKIPKLVVKDGLYVRTGQRTQTLKMPTQFNVTNR